MDEVGKGVHAMLLEGAMAQANKNNLICEDGSIICWDCRKRLAMMPSLHCPLCLAEAWRRMGIVEPACPNYEQEKQK